jgi:hypothetical protein
VTDGADIMTYAPLRSAVQRNVPNDICQNVRVRVRARARALVCVCVPVCVRSRARAC